MGPETVGTVVVAFIALASAIYTANQGRKSAAAAAAVAEKDSERDAQLAFLGLLSSEVQTLNAQVVALRARLAQAEDSADDERQKRREIERSMETVVAQVARLQEILGNIPTVADHPEVRAVVDALLRHRRAA